MIEIQKRSPQLQEELIDEGSRRRFIVTEYKSLCDRMEENLRNKYPHADTVQIECLLIESLIGGSTELMKTIYSNDPTMQPLSNLSTQKKVEIKDIPLTLVEFSKEYEWPSLNGIRKMVVQRKKNGLEAAFLKFKGRRLVLPKTFFRLIKLNGQIPRTRKRKSFLARVCKKWIG